MFKVGDVIVCIDNSNANHNLIDIMTDRDKYLTIGKKYTILQDGSPINSVLIIDNNIGQRAAYRKNRFIPLMK